MATISTATYLDDAARTSAETWTLNPGGILTIRTDTRWHAGSPTSMTGILGTLTASGGGVVVDGTKVRWMPYDTGTGTVPAIGTTITQGGVSGYLLGVWADYTSAPTAVGGAMPATGYIKFREVTGGTFSAGALTGISANATSADVTGWIEVVLVSNGFYVGSFSGPGFISTGDWFYLGTTNGSRGQTVQIPTNAGGAATGISGIQIETSPGSNTYEWYGSVPTANWAAASIATDARGKLVESAGNGLIRIGANSAATAIGYLPASGCKIRVPNIFLRSAASGTAATNTLTNTITARGQFQSTTGPIISCSKTSIDWGMSQSMGSSVLVTLTDSVLDGGIITTLLCRGVTLTNTCIGQQTAYTSSPVSFTLGNNVSISSSVMTSTAAAICTLSSASNSTLSGLKLIRVSATTAAGQLTISNSSSISASNVTTIGGGISITNSSGVVIDGHDYTNQTSGATSTGGTCLTVTTSGAITHKNLTFGLNGALANSHPNGALYTITNSTGPIKCYNAGTQVSPLSGGSANVVQYIFNGNASTNNSNLYFKRIYVSTVGQNMFIAGGTNKNIVIENIAAQSAAVPITALNDGLSKATFGQFAASPSTGSFYGCHFVDTYYASGGTWCFAPGATPSSASSSVISYSITSSGDSGWDNAGNLKFNTNNDTLTIETPYYVKGSTAFTGTISGTQANTSYVYWVDTGSGYGSSKTLNSTNLLTETLNPAGTKMKIQMTKTGGTSVTHTAIKIETVSSTSDQTGNLYPLDTVSLTFTGLVAGSEVRCYTGSDPATAVEIGGVESSGTSFSFTHSSGGTVGFIRIFAMGYQPFNYDPYTYQSADTTLLVQQVVDRNYVNPP